MDTSSISNDSAAHHGSSHHTHQGEPLAAALEPILTPTFQAGLSEESMSVEALTNAKLHSVPMPVAAMAPSPSSSDDGAGEDVTTLQQETKNISWFKMPREYKLQWIAFFWLGTINNLSYVVVK
jgi:hypothetical protein